MCGVVSGSMATSVTDPDVYLAGASGGVYALISAHLANVAFNWSEMEFLALRLAAFLLLAGVDTGVAVYYRYVAGVDTRVSYVSHIAGALAGETMDFRMTLLKSQDSPQISLYKNYSRQKFATILKLSLNTITKFHTMFALIFKVSSWESSFSATFASAPGRGWFGGAPCSPSSPSSSQGSCGTRSSSGWTRSTWHET